MQSRCRKFPLFICTVLIVVGPARVRGAEGLSIGWTNNMLTISGPNLPGQKVEIWYLEAFCRSGSTHRDWRQTTISHKTELVKSDATGKRLQLRTRVEPAIEVLHEIRAGTDEVD